MRAVSTVAVLGLAMACTGSDGADTAASASSRTDRAANDPGAAVVDASQAAAPAGAGAAAQREAATTTATTSQAVAPPEPLGGTGAGAAPDPGSSSGLDGGEATGEPPRVEVGRLRGGGTADHGCDFAVRIKGVPAIRADGELFVFEAGDASDLSDFPPRSLVAVATADGSERFVHDFHRMDHSHLGTGKRPRKCRALRAELQRRAQTVNAELARSGWRQLEPLAAERLDSDEKPDVAGVPAAERSVVLYHRHGELIAKIPGLSVLWRHPAPWRYDPGWDSDLQMNPRELCSASPIIDGLFFDRATRKGLVLITYNTSDMCPHPGDEPHVVELPEALISECDRRAAE